jgi:hypothetical protein
MKARVSLLTFACLLLAVPAVQATSVTVNLGESAQNYTLIGQGAYAPYLPFQYGTYLNTQGACTSGASSTSCTLSGTYTGTTAGYTGGTYDFVTTYAGTGPSELATISEDPLGFANEDYFVINSVPAGTTMYLDLDETGGPDYSIPIYVGGTFVGGYSVAFVNGACGGTALPGGDPCEQIYVGLTPGATLSGQVTGESTFDTSTVTATPEPGTLGLLGSGMLGLAGLVGRRRRSA